MIDDNHIALLAADDRYFRLYDGDMKPIMCHADDKVQVDFAAFEKGLNDWSVFLLNCCSQLGLENRFDKEKNRLKKCIFRLADNNICFSAIDEWREDFGMDAKGGGVALFYMRQ